MDGNNSLKHVGSALQDCDEIPDSRQVTSERWLSPDEVNVFAWEESVVVGI